jgi:hypothetical protein
MLPLAFTEPSCCPRSEAGVRFVDAGAPPLDGSMLPVRVPALTGLARGKLRDVIDDAIERELEALGAPPPGSNGHADLDTTLSDQLYRARRAGVIGIAVHVPPLHRVATLAGALDAEDSAVLRFFFSAARERPILVLLDESNRALGAYGPPTRLDQLTGEAPIANDGEHGSDAPAPLGPSAAAELRTDTPEPTADTNEPTASPAEPTDDVLERADETPPPPPVTLRPAPVAPCESEWRRWTGELDAARGPKPLATIERLFVTRYVPLADAILRGHADRAAQAVHDAWSASFAKSYTEAFGALRVTGKRPRMVLDAPQLAARIARLHGARSQQLLIIDGMRFDVGLRVHDRLREGLGTHATCTERLLLWAALPTTTPAQLDLIAHGPEGLSDRGPPSEREDLALGTRNAQPPRRIRLGGRELMKLDVVEARVRESGPGVPERLDAIADEAARSILPYIRSLAPRTLVFMFGDHGFRMVPAGDRSGPGTCGGATPDEVLVPALAWLVGDVH